LLFFGKSMEFRSSVMRVREEKKIIGPREVGNGGKPPKASITTVRVARGS